MKRKRKWWVENRYYPTEVDPRFGQCFQIHAIQTVNIDGRYSDWTPCEINENELISVGKTWNEWKKKKQQISDLLVKVFNDGTIEVPIKDVIALKVQYLGDTSIQIL